VIFSLPSPKQYQRIVLKNYFQICEKDTVNNVIRKTPLIVSDPITQRPVISAYAYKDYVKNQLKFLIQNCIF